MPTIDLGQVKGDTGTSIRMRHAWTANTDYVNNSQYIDIVTYGGNSYSCKTSHTSGSTFVDTNWDMIAKKGEKGEKGNTGDVPTIGVGTVTSLDSTASPTVSASTNGNTTKFNFGIPKGDTSDIKTPTFDDSVGTYSTLSAANTAAETASNAIKSKVSIFTTLSNMKKSFSAIVQGLKILGTNVGAINGITDSLTSTSSNVAASAAAIKALNDKTTELNSKMNTCNILVSWFSEIIGGEGHHGQPFNPDEYDLYYLEFMYGDFREDSALIPRQVLKERKIRFEAAYTGAGVVPGAEISLQNDRIYIFVNTPYWPVNVYGIK